MNSINWKELEHAYGDASNIPDLLDELSKYPICENCDDEPWFSLWSSLCHQGDIYTASFAAVPTVVSLIENAPSPVDYDFYLLPISIQIAVLKGNAPPIPRQLEKPYKNAISLLPELAAKEKPKDELMVRILSSAIAAKSGNALLAEAILELEPDVLEDFEEWVHSR